MYSECIKMLNEIKSFIGKKDKRFSKRKSSKLNMYDTIIYRLLYTQKNKSQHNIVSKINKYTHNIVNRSNYVKRESTIDINIYKRLNNIITKYEHKIKNKNIYSHTIYAVDGTDSNMNKKLVDKGYILNKNNESISPLILGVYNITKNYPITLDLVKHKNERKAFIDFLKGAKINKKSIFVFDRGFFSYNAVDALLKRNLQFVFRLKSNSRLIDDNKGDDYTISISYNDKKYTFRIVKYIVNKTTYHVASNIFDENEYPIDAFKNIYHSRWTIEEYFKLVKKNMKLSRFEEKTEKSILKSIYSQLILTKISSIIEMCYDRIHLRDQDDKKVNRSNLLEGFYDSFLLDVFYKRVTNKKFKHFINTYVVIHSSPDGRKFKRTCNTPYFKWYIKRYFKKYKQKSKPTEEKSEGIT